MIQQGGSTNTSILSCLGIDRKQQDIPSLIMPYKNLGEEFTTPCYDFPVGAS